MVDIYEGNKGKPIVDSGWMLFDVNDLPALAGQTVEDFRGAKWTLTGGHKPTSINSSGRVYVRAILPGKKFGMTQSFFPSVFGMGWKDTD